MHIIAKKPIFSRFGRTPFQPPSCYTYIVHTYVGGLGFKVGLSDVCPRLLVQMAEAQGKHHAANWKEAQAALSRQTNGYDCGLFVCAFAAYIASDRQIKADQVVQYFLYIEMDLCAQLIPTFPGSNGPLVTADSLSEFLRPR